MKLKTAGLAVAIALGAVGGTAWAAQTVASIIGPDGTINGCYTQNKGALRVVEAGQPCDKNELPIQWNQKGPKGDKGDPGEPGPRGDTGPPGPALTSLAGIPCDTGSLDKPDGRIDVSVAADTGAITLTCRSASTNPVLTVLLIAGPETCVTVLGITTCFNARFDVREVDAAGSPVANGFTCTSAPNLSPFPVTCQTQRFAAGATVRLEALGAPAGFVPTWSGCDSVDGAVCTATMSAARTVAVTPVSG